MKRKIIWTTLTLLLFVSLYLVNRSVQIIAWNSLNVKAKDGLSVDRVLIKQKATGDTVFFEGAKQKEIKTDYGENDFVIIYDGKYYRQLRHFIFNRRNKHHYSFVLYKQHDTIFIKAKISGNNDEEFEEPMHLIEGAKEFTFQ